MSSTRSRLLSLGQTKLRRLVRLVLEQLEDRWLPAPVAGTWLVQFDSLAGDTQDTQIADASQRLVAAGLDVSGIQVMSHSGTSGIVLVNALGFTEEGLESTLQRADGFLGADVYDPFSSSTSEFPVRFGPGSRGAQPGTAGVGDVGLEIAGPTTGSGYDGIRSDQAAFFRPPDITGAAGPSSYVQAVNSAVAIYNKSGGVIAGPTLATTFYNSVRQTSFIFDPVVVYNEHTQRFAVGFAENSGTTISRFMLAISKSSNPTTFTSADWNFYSFNTDDSTAGFQFGDYPKMGYNADGYVITFNQFLNASSFQHTAVLAVRNDGTSPGTLVVPGGLNRFTLAPASIHDNVPGGSMYFVETGSLQFTSTTVKVVRMDNVYTATPSYTDTFINVNPYFFTQSPHQPNGQLVGNSNLGTRFYFAGMRNVAGVTHLVAAHTSATAASPNNGFSQVRWYDFEVDGAPSLVQQGTVSAGATTDTYFPDIDIAADGSIGLGYMQSSATQFVSGYVTGRLAGDPLGTMQTPVLAKAGTQNLNPNDRIGDYADVSVDPANGSFWYTFQYANSLANNPNWRTWIQSFSLAASFSVAATTPAGGSTVGVAPTSYTVDFSANYDLGSVQAGDFKVNGIPATGIVIVDGNTLTFTYGSTPAGEGLNTMTITGGDITGGGIPITGFSAQFRVDAVPLAVVTTNPTPGGVITLTGGNQTIRVFFNEAVNPATVGTSDFLVNQGTVVLATPVLGNTAVDVVISGLVTEGSLTLNIGANAFTDTAGNANPAGFSATYVLDYVTRAYPTPLTPKNPLGSLVYDPSIGGLINFAGDTDTFTLNVDPGQNITLLVDPAGSPEPTMYGGTGNGAGAAAGQLLLVDQTTASSTFIGDPVTPGGLSGLVFDPSTGVFFGTTIQSFANASNLVRIDPNTGALLSTVGTVRVGSASGPTIPIGDLAIQPGTNILYAVRSNSGSGGFGELYTIDKTTGIATLIGSTGSGAGGGLAFAPDGSLYQTAYNNGFDFTSLNKINPANAARISTVSLPTYFDGLAIRPTDGAFYANQGGGGTAVYTINPSTGAITFIGDTSASTSDLAFRPSTALAPTIELRDPSNALLGSASSAGNGLNALLQTVATTTGGSYKFIVSGASGTVGGYTLQVVLNAALEREGLVPGGANNTRATAQDINGSFANLDTTLAHASRGAVLGSLSPNSVTLTALDSGWYDSTGFHDSFNKNYFLGQFPPLQYRDYFVFNLAGLTPGFTSAQLNLFNPAGGYSSPFATDTFSLFDVSTAIPTLMASNSGQVGIFNDLGSGTGYGSSIVSAASNGQIVSTNLNASALAAINAAIGGQFAFGGAITSLVGSNTQFLFGFTGAPTDTRQLVLSSTESEYYSISLTAGERATVALKNLTGGGTTLRIEDANGVVLASGVGGATNLDQVIANFLAPTSGTYYLVVNGGSAATYDLVVTKNAAFDTEANDTLATAQNVTGTHGALGHIPASGGPAIRVAVKAGTYSPTLVAQLNNDTFFNFSAVEVADTGLDSPAELAAYDVVVLGEWTTTLSSATASALRIWVQSGAGGVVSTAFLNYNLDFISPAGPRTDLDAIVPVQLVSGFGVGYDFNMNGVTVTNGSHPVTQGVTNFIINNGFTPGEDMYFGADGGATILAVNPTTGRPAVVVGQAGSGRTAWLGAGYFLGNPLLVTGSPDRLLEQAVAWAAPPAIAEDWYKVTLAPGETVVEVETRTPADGSGEFVNLLNPKIQFFNAAGVNITPAVTILSDGRNEKFRATGLTAGATYYVKVSSEGGTQGEYFAGIKTLKTPTPKVTVDNTGFQFSTTAAWALTSGAGHGGSYRSKAGVPGGTSYAQWTYSLTFDGSPYDVYATWVPLPGNATDAKYSVSVDGGTATVVTVNQRLSPNTALVGGTLWQKLLTITPAAGFHVVRVRLLEDANGTVVADAVFDPPQAVRKSGGKVKVHRGDQERGRPQGRDRFFAALAEEELSRKATRRRGGRR